MKKLIFVCCLLCGLNQAVMAQLSVTASQTPPYEEDYTTRGSISLNITGGSPPYTTAWAHGATGPTLSNLEPGLYSYTVTGKNGVKVAGNVQLNTYAKWMNADGVSVDENTIDKDASSGWGNAGTHSINMLKNEQDGFVSYTAGVNNTTFVFGLGFADGSATRTYPDVEYGFLFEAGVVKIVKNGETQTVLSAPASGDIYKVEKRVNNLLFFKNTTQVGETYILSSAYDLRAEIAINPSNGQVRNVRASFFTPALKATSAHGNIRAGEANTGYLSLSGVYGVPPYSYTWDDDAGNAIYDLSEGEHHGVVTDAVGNTAHVYEAIGHEAAYLQLNNLNISADGMKKVNGTEPANATLNRYLAADGGWVELKLRDNATDFNLLVRPINLNEEGTLVSPFVRHVSADVVISAAEIAAMTAAQYTLLNIVSAANYPQSVVVRQYKFVLADDVSETVLSTMHGIVCKQGKLYVLKGGSTIQKPIDIAKGDVLRLNKGATSFELKLNGLLVYTGPITSMGDAAVNLNLWDYNMLHDYLTTGGGASYPNSVTCSGATRNWEGTTEYDGYLNVVAESRKYMDDLGRETQILTKNVSKNNVIVRQTLYDIFGRRVLQTLPAPTFQPNMCYVDNFFNNQSSAAYNTSDFDVPNWSTNYYNLTPGERDAPKDVDISYKGSVGWYYSDNNNEEPFVATAGTPYQRIEYCTTYPTEIARTSKAGLGVNHGSGRETYNLTMKTAGELSYFFGFVNSWKVTDLESHFTNYTACRSISSITTQPMMNMEGTAIKKISVDENGSESIEFNDAMGNVIGSCLSGAVNGSNQQVQTVLDYIDKDPNNIFQWVDVHVPDGCQGTLELEQYNNQLLYDIIDIKTGRLVHYLFGQAGSGAGGTGTKPALSPGYYRIKLVSMPSGYHNLIKVKYSTNYYNFTANYYDQANRLRITVPPKGIDYSGAQLAGYTISSGHVAKKFETTDNHANLTFGGAQPNFAYYPDNWELGAGSGSHEVSLNILNINNYWMQNFVVKFVGKNTAWSMTQFPDEPGGGEAYRTSGGTEIVSGNLLRQKYILSETDEAYSTKKAVKPFDPNDTLLPQGFNAFSIGGTFCTSTVMPVVIKYQIVDGANTPITGVTYVTGYCTINQCTGNTISYSRTWTFPQQQTFQLPTNTYTTNFVAKLQILDLYLVQNFPAYPAGIPWQFYTDITADFSARSGAKPIVPDHTMTEVYEYNSWGELTISKKPDSGETDYIYSPDGSVRATQNSKQDMAGSATTDRFSYINYDVNGRPIEAGEYDRGAASASPNIKFKNYRQFMSDNTAPSMIIEANNNNPVTDAARLKETRYNLYDVPDPNFTSQTGLSAALFPQEYLIGKLSRTANADQVTWFSYDELGRVKWKVSRYQNVTENTTPSNNYIVKTFYYNHDYLGNVTEQYYQYHLPATTVSDRMKQEFFYDADKRVLKAQSTIYATAVPVTKTNAQYFYYLHGPLKRCQLGGNLQGIDYVYTVNGWLKNMNSPEMDPTHDPGVDGAATLGNSTFEDLYGQSLDYFNGDYERSFTKVQTSKNLVADNYNGSISSYRWQTKLPAAAVAGFSHPNLQLVYAYDYDKKNQMTMAQFGFVSANHVSPTQGGLNTSPDVTPGESYRVQTGYDDNGNITSLSRLAYYGGPNGLFMDDLSYNYIPCSNKLNYVTDGTTGSPIDPYSSVGFPAGQTTGNYVYNTLGELITDQMNGKKYKYNCDGQISEVTDLTGNKILEYKYDAGGLRFMKLAYDPVQQSNVLKTLYVRDDEGAVVAVLQKSITSTQFVAKEWDITVQNRIATAFKVGSDVSYVYELNDHLGSTRTSFEEGKKTSLSTYFGNHMKTADIKYFTDPYNSLVQFQAGNGWSSVYTPGKPSGIQSVNLPAAPGDGITVSIQAKYAGTTLPAASLVIQLLDPNNNLITSSAAPVLSTSQNNNWVTISSSLSNGTSGNAFFKVFVKNTSAQAADFDNVTITFSQGGVRVPVQLAVNNYYPHGSHMPGLNYNGSLGGRHGYQGQFSERDVEISELFFNLRNYDPLLGRFKAIDPYQQYYSPYLAMGNNFPNMVDPNGGVSYSWVGTAIGLGAGLVGYLIHDLTSDSKHTIDKPWYNYAGWGLAGAVAGGVVGGFAKTHFKLNKAEFWGYTFTKRRYSQQTGHSKWTVKAPKGLQGQGALAKIHFSFGIRFANWILLDIRFNSQNDNNYQINFPGRWGLGGASPFRFSFIPKFVYPGNPGHYRYISLQHIHFPLFCFFGGYTWFVEHLGSDSNVTHQQ